MNIVDAIKSGRRFKRQKWPCTSWMESTGSFGSSVESMIADDWEIEDVSVTITREQFDAAWKKVWPHDPYGDGLNSINPYSDVARSALAKELGL